MRKYIQFLFIVIQLIAFGAIIWIILSGKYEENNGFFLSGVKQYLPVLLLGIITVSMVFELIWKSQPKYPIARLIVLIMVDLLAIITIMNKRFSLFNTMLLLVSGANGLLLLYSMVIYRFNSTSITPLPLSFLCKRDLFKFLTVVSITIILFFTSMILVLRLQRISAAVISLSLGILFLTAEFLVHITKINRLFDRFKHSLEYDKLNNKLEFYYRHVLNSQTRFLLMYRHCFILYAIDKEKANALFENIQKLDRNNVELEYNIVLSLYFLYNNRYNEFDCQVQECQNYIHLTNKGKKYMDELSKLIKIKDAFTGVIPEDELDLYFLDNRALSKYDFYKNVYIRFCYYKVCKMDRWKEYQVILIEDENALIQYKKDASL